MEAHLKTAGESLEFVNKLEVTNKVNPECFDRFQEIKIRRRHRFIIFRIGAEEIEVETVGERKASYEELKRLLPYTECRFALFDQEYLTADKRPQSKLWFISWFPNNATTHAKMAYASAKGRFREFLEGVFDTQVASTEELDANLGLAKEEEEEDDGFDF